MYVRFHRTQAKMHILSNVEKKLLNEIKFSDSYNDYNTLTDGEACGCLYRKMSIDHFYVSE